MPFENPTRKMPYRFPKPEDPLFGRAFFTWIADGLRSMPAWIAWRIACHLEAMLHGQVAGLCRNCGENVTWPVPGYLDHCPACGIRDPCPPSEGGSGVD